MAAPTPVRVKTIGRTIGRDYDSGMTFEESMVRSEGLKLSKEPLKTPIVKNLEKGRPDEVNIPDLPLDSDPTNKLHQWVEIIHPYEDEVNIEELEKACLRNQTKDIPKKLRSKEECPYPCVQQLFIVDNPDNTKTALKFFTLTVKEKIRVDTIQRMSHGIMFKIDYGTNFVNGS